MCAEDTGWHARNLAERAVHTEKVWTWSEISKFEAEHDVRSGAKEFPDGPPAYWPAGVDMNMGRWTTWLPTGWAMGSRLRRTVFVDATGKVAYQKRDVERIVTQSGGSLRTYTGPAPEPPEWPSWLPRTWAFSYKPLGNGHKKLMYIKPDGLRYFWSKPDVESHVSTGSPPGIFLLLESHILESIQRSADMPGSAEGATDLARPECGETVLAETVEPEAVTEVPSQPAHSEGADRVETEAPAPEVIADMPSQPSHPEGVLCFTLMALEHADDAGFSGTSKKLSGWNMEPLSADQRIIFVTVQLTSSSILFSLKGSSVSPWAF